MTTRPRLTPSRSYCWTLVVFALVFLKSNTVTSHTSHSVRNLCMVSKSLSTRSVESGLHKRGFRFIIGSDEAGRGCIAGPVVVASYSSLITQPSIGGVDDSKNLSEKERIRIHDEILLRPDAHAWTVAESSNLDIEESNILKATMDSFQESIESLVAKYELPWNETYSIVDGKKTPKLSILVPCRPFVKGDSKVYTVALASVIAKVTRDNIMVKAHELYPEYGFDKHKGYPTRDHIEAIHRHGPCPLHRMTFKPLKGR